jgi:hypothetical protein
MAGGPLFPSKAEPRGLSDGVKFPENGAAVEARSSLVLLAAMCVGENRIDFHQIICIDKADLAKRRATRRCRITGRNPSDTKAQSDT